MSEITKDTWKLGEHEFSSRFILGSGKYSLELIDAAVKEAKAEIVTMALRRANEGGVANILDYIPKNVTLLPNTSGARNAEEAVHKRTDSAPGKRLNHITADSADSKNCNFCICKPFHIICTQQ